jgi:hypothetical protein
MAPRTEAPAKEEQHKNTERVESAITKSPSDPSPFLKELDSITGPGQAKAISQLDKDGYGGRATALEAQKIMDTVNPSHWYSHGSGQITKEDVQKYSDKATDPAEKAVAKKLSDNFVHLAHDGITMTQADIDKTIKTEQNTSDMRNLHAKGNDGKSLLDSVSDSHGNVSGDKLDKALQNPGLTEQDKSSLQRLNAARETSWGSPTGDLSADKVKKLDENASLTPKEIAGVKKQGEPQSADQQATQAALKDLNAKPGGGESLLDKIGDGKGGIDQAKAADIAAHPERHNLTEENKKTLKTLNDQIDQNTISNMSMDGNVAPRMNLDKTDLQKMGADAGVDYNKVADKPATPAEGLDQKTREAQFAHLFEKSGSKPSLYDQIKNPDGSVSRANIEKAESGALSDKDRASLGYLKTLEEDKGGLKGLLGGKKDFSKEDLADKAHEHNLNDAALKGAHLDTPPAAKPEVQGPTRPEVQGPPAPPAEKPEVQKALQIHKGEGYYHAAERLLTEAHKGQHDYEPSQHDLKQLVKELQGANGHKKSLSSKEGLKIDDAVRHNPALAALFASA